MKFDKQHAMSHSVGHGSLFAKLLFFGCEDDVGDENEESKITLLRDSIRWNIRVMIFVILGIQMNGDGDYRKKFKLGFW